MSGAGAELGDGKVLGRRMRRAAGWVLMALSVALVGLSAELALPYGTQEAVVFALLPLPGLAAALVADRFAVRWPLGVLGAVYAAASLVLFMLYFVYVGLLWMAAAGLFAKARLDRPATRAL